MQDGQQRAAEEEVVRLSDDEIENAVQVALLQNPRVFPFKPGVSVNNNVATLSGTVGNLKARNSAAQVAFDIDGVRSVVNNIEIKPERQVSDAELEKRASQALSRDVLLEPGDNVQVEVDDAVATITGNPDSHFEKMQALDAVAKVNGIVEIKDQLSVDYNIPAVTYVYDWDPLAYDFGFDYPMADGRSDDEIAREINAEFKSSPYVDSGAVNVSVNEGVATLNGTVDSWSEYNAAMENALDAGASKVINRLNVEGSS
jgi:osmotically-inducible protein OsmY